MLLVLRSCSCRCQKFDSTLSYLDHLILNINMKLKFSANVSTLFNDYPFLERFRKAKENGFDTIEMQSPYEFTPSDFKSAMEGLRCDLINSPDHSSFGLASDPTKVMDFCNSFQEVIGYYNVLSFKKIHILAGCKNEEEYTYEDQLNTYKQNLLSLVESDFLENRNAIGLIEPICSEVKEDYFLNSFDLAVEIIEEVNSDQIKLLLDVYHLHKITGNVKENLQKYYKYAGHIQVSQDPGRVEPFHPAGQIDYDYVFKFLLENNHSDVIGLEYIPSGKTEDSFEWMKKYI